MQNISNSAIILLKEFQKMGVFSDIFQLNTMYPDEPQIPVYSCQLKFNKKFTDGSTFYIEGYGSSLYKKSYGLFKSFMEALERFNQGCYKNKNILFTSFSKLNEDALNPNIYTKSDNKKIKFGWVPAKNALTNKNILIPAQLVYFTYNRKKEPTLVDMNTSGGAAGLDHESTLLNSIYELVERDAFMSMYLTKSPIPKINPKSIKNGTVKKFLQYMYRYNLEPMIFDMTTDINIPSFLTILVNHTGIGPGISLGAKSSLNKERALIGSLEESIQGRIIPRLWFSQDRGQLPPIDIKKISTVKQRAFYWYPVSMIKHLDFLIKQPSIKLDMFSLQRNEKTELSIVKSIFKQKNIDVYYVDITLENFKKKGLYVYKTIIPALQNFHLNEESRRFNINSSRLQTVSTHFGEKSFNLNTIPQPFL